MALPMQTLAAEAAPSALTSYERRVLGVAKREAERVGSRLWRSDLIGIADFAQPSWKPRFHFANIEAGTVRRLEQGKPIHGEVVRLRPREHFPMVCDVEVEVPAQRSSEPFAVSSGPAQVATENYRKNWDAIYGSKKQRSMLN